MTWTNRLRYDPIPMLESADNETLRHFTKRDLLAESPGPVEKLWRLPAAERMVESQQENGSWKYHGGRERIRSSEDYDQIETFRIMRYLVEKYGFNKKNQSFEKAAGFMFSHQTKAGDFRGICGRQYVPYYSAAIMELLIKGGYAEDPRIQRGFNWLISMRQNDGGWAFPMRTVGLILSPDVFKSPPAEPDRTKPFSHLVTAIVLRAFAAHSTYRRSRIAKEAGQLLVRRFFRPDKYPDRQAASFWTSFSFPFWFTDLLSSFDALSQIGLDENDPQVAGGLDWFITKQQKDGLWRLRLRAMASEKEPNHWISLALCRVFKRLGD